MSDDESLDIIHKNSKVEEIEKTDVEPLLGSETSIQGTLHTHIHTLT